MQQGQGQGRRAVLAGGAGVALSSALRPVRPARAVDVGQAAPKVRGRPERGAAGPTLLTRTVRSSRCRRAAAGR